MTIEQHLTTKEIATLLSCSPDTVLRLAQRGDIESVFWGRERRYPESGITNYLQKSAAKANPQHGNVIPLRAAK